MRGGGRDLGVGVCSKTESTEALRPLYPLGPSLGDSALDEAGPGVLVTDAWRPLYPLGPGLGESALDDVDPGVLVIEGVGLVSEEVLLRR